MDILMLRKIPFYLKFSLLFIVLGLGCYNKRKSGDETWEVKFNMSTDKLLPNIQAKNSDLKTDLWKPHP